jgi:DNA-binding response OmpR family regulator
MVEILVATDAPWLYEEIRSVTAGPEVTLRWVRTGPMVLTAIRRVVPDLVITDFQIGNMGGMAICLDLRLEEGAGRADHIPVLMLLDRQADIFLARRASAEGWLVKPLNPIRLRRAIAALLGGGTYFDGQPALAARPVVPPPAIAGLPEAAQLPPSEVVSAS